ncbi:MAG TPA: AmmeMemoRadiSam system protein A [Candidatus Limnocylindrales bacterium]|nr:AmmeMemoRadiSam system protein A [Candidatus Limnocylindrales bacterium]
MKEEELLSFDLQQKLLHIAWETLSIYLIHKKVPEIVVTEPELQMKKGVFVTLKKGDLLRGCIGDIDGKRSLWQSAQEIVIAAATRDPRFPPLTEEELKDIHIEISVLSPFEKISDPTCIRIGQHGILVKKSPFSGLLLPQVAVEQGWDTLTFLEHACKKAWLPGDAWKDPETEIYVFTAQVFGAKPTLDSRYSLSHSTSE